VIHRFWCSVCAPRPWLEWTMQTIPGTAFRWALTMLCVLVGWVFFRAQSFADAGTVLSRMFVPTTEGLGCPLHDMAVWYTVVVLATCTAGGHHQLWPKISKRLPAPVLGVSYSVVLTLALLLAPPTGKSFIYFQF